MPHSGNTPQGRPPRRALAIKTIGAVVALVVASGAAPDAKIKIKSQFDKTFNFATLKTWAWHPDGGGDVKVLQSMDDPAVIKARVDPIIRSAITSELTKKGLTTAPADRADLLVYYYVLVGPQISTQYMGQFVASTPEWGLPVFSGATTSYEVHEQGALIIDLVAPALKAPVWRGAADTEIDRERTPAERQKLLVGAIADMFKKFPPKK